jgi:hypothetical protein
MNQEIAFNLVKILEQVDHNEFELNTQSTEWRSREVIFLVDGIQDGEVKWNPDPETEGFG